jgi:hypothetical protein
MENLKERRDILMPAFASKKYDIPKVVKVQSIVRRWLEVRALHQRSMSNLMLC